MLYKFMSSWELEADYSDSSDLAYRLRFYRLLDRSLSRSFFVADLIFGYLFYSGGPFYPRDYTRSSRIFCTRLRAASYFLLPQGLDINKICLILKKPSCTFDSIHCELRNLRPPSHVCSSVFAYLLACIRGLLPY